VCRTYLRYAESRIWEYLGRRSAVLATQAIFTPDRQIIVYYPRVIPQRNDGDETPDLGPRDINESNPINPGKAVALFTPLSRIQIWPCGATGEHIALSRRRRRVQIPPGSFESGRVDQRKIACMTRRKSLVRIQPWPLEQSTEVRD
jgi:hypothetical protein